MSVLWQHYMESTHATCGSRNPSPTKASRACNPYGQVLFEKQRKEFNLVLAYEDLAHYYFQAADMPFSKLCWGCLDPTLIEVSHVKALFKALFVLLVFELKDLDMGFIDSQASCLSGHQILAYKRMDCRDLGPFFDPSESALLTFIKQATKKCQEIGCSCKVEVQGHLNMAIYEFRLPSS
eukprot:Gb_25850 [translate_table: standard]